MKAERLFPALDNMDDEERLKVFMHELEDWFINSPYRLLFRKHKYQYAGVVVDTNMQKFDSQYGRPLAWLSVWKTNGGNHRNFELESYNEPRMHKIPVTGELKDTILMENPMLVLCARNSEGMGNDMVDYTYEVSENEMNQHTSMALQMDMMKTSLMDMEEKMGEYRIEAERNLSLARNYGERATKTESELSRLEEYSFVQDRKIQGLERELHLRDIKVREDDAEIAMNERNAEERGAFRGMTDSERISKTVDDQNELKEKLQELSSPEVTQGSYTVVKKQVEDIGEKVKAMEKEKIETHNKKEEV
jgi:hypothetical protein